MRHSTLQLHRRARLDRVGRRFFSQEKPTHPDAISKTINPNSSPNGSLDDVAREARKQQSRLDRLLKRTPKFMQRHVVALRSAPITHISAFLILHEITAVVPLFGLAGAFHYYHWLPTYFSEGAWVVAGVEMFGRYFRRKGWISDAEEQEAERLSENGEAATVEEKRKFTPSKIWGKGEDGVRLVVEFATAYAIVKALLIPRLMLSAWGAPWFAKWSVIPVVNIFKRAFRRNKFSGKSA